MRVAARSLAVLFIGLAFGATGAMASWWTPRVGGIALPVGALLAIVAVALVARALAWWAGGRWGAIACSVGWIAATLAMGTTSPNGDIVLSSGTRQIAYLVVGSMVLAACCGFPLLPENEAPEPAAALGSSRG